MANKRIRLFLFNDSATRLMARTSSAYEEVAAFARYQLNEYGREAIAYEEPDPNGYDDSPYHSQPQYAAGAIVAMHYGRALNGWTAKKVRDFVRDYELDEDDNIPGLITLYENDEIARGLSTPSAPASAGPRKPPPALPVEVHNPHPVDAARAWAEVIAACKGV